MFKSVLKAIALAVICVAVNSTKAQEVPLNTNITTTRPSCLPQNWNSAFSGTRYSVFSLNNWGTVYSWNCLNADRSLRERYAIVVLESFVLNPLCSSLGIDRLRVVESSAATSVFNMLTSCGRSPEASSSEWDKYTRLLTIGQAQPENQEAVARQWVGENFRSSSSPPLNSGD